MDQLRGYVQTDAHVLARIAARLATLAAKPKPVSKDWLVSHYALLGIDCVQIGGMVGKDPKTIWSWMKHYGIETRPRGSDKRQWFSKGHASPFAGRKHSEETKEAIRRARLADGRVPYLLKNGEHAMRGRTGDKHPGWKGGRTPERQAFYASTEWKEACKSVWTRANALCERCGTDHRAEGMRGTFHVHHIVSFQVRELRATVSNLALLCDKCHRFVHSKRNTTREFLK